jgi:hypothetical protein
MRIRTSVAALALTAGAAVGGLALAGPALANPQNGLVNVYAQDVASGNQGFCCRTYLSASPRTCGLTTNVLSTELLSGNHAVCTAKNSSHTISWVSYS